MAILRILLLGLVLIGVASCGGNSKFKSYNGPEVTRLVVLKGERKLRLYHGRKVLEEYDIGLGFQPRGHKIYEGDGRTPEGHYYINRRNPNSKYHLSLGISYPDVNDVQVARATGRRPGGDIFIHGRGKFYERGRGSDWTAGCIAVTDREIEQIYAMVRDGTPITIYP
ncbi:L,D-transpeptidase family protein [Palleronia caenipelagi]|uniref:L,D-TPase catalytic domain-containing protein n=1 Tax=Palleronia caenipelagi TaxID=2489174 RepID=A0A547Q6G9_9RHOB|nr:L,D-transpeptidase family protein [Palleronia caenipelagi]TRD21978.1 hypothetical protein FEV53_06275 [Palleronia caenipelagi]